jgi:hypothetical protein
MITREPINTAQAIRERRFDGKIVVGGFDVECIRWNKIVHIQTVRRLPKIHKDGRVTIRAFNDEYEIKATRCTLDSTGQSWVSYDLA